MGNEWMHGDAAASVVQTLFHAAMHATDPREGARWARQLVAFSETCRTAHFAWKLHLGGGVRRSGGDDDDVAQCGALVRLGLLAGGGRSSSARALTKRFWRDMHTEACLRFWRNIDEADWASDGDDAERFGGARVTRVATVAAAHGSRSGLHFVQLEACDGGSSGFAERVDAVLEQPSCGWGATCLQLVYAWQFRTGEWSPPKDLPGRLKWRRKALCEWTAMFASATGVAMQMYNGGIAVRVELDAHPDAAGPCAMHAFLAPVQGFGRRKTFLLRKSHLHRTAGAPGP